MKLDRFISKPLTVEGALFDGSDEAIEDFCKTWPNDFMEGDDKDGTKHLVIIVRGKNLGNICVLPVAPGDMVYREFGSSFCSTAADSFKRYFKSNNTIITLGPEVTE